MVLIRAETVVPYGCTCDGSAVAKEYDGVCIRGALLPSYPKAFKELKAEGVMPGSCELRQSKYLNNLVDAATIVRVKRLVKLGMGFFSFETAWRTLAEDMK